MGEREGEREREREREREHWTTLGQTDPYCCVRSGGGGQSVGHRRTPLIAATISRFEGGEEKDERGERERGNIKCRMDRRV